MNKNSCYEAFRLPRVRRLFNFPIRFSMARSFRTITATEDDALTKNEPIRRHVLVTGAAGHIGSYFTQNASEHFDLRLMVQQGKDTSHITKCGEMVTGDLLDLEHLNAVCEGIDTVVHTTGEPSPDAT